MITLGVCSWSLQADSPEDLASKVQEVELDTLHLWLDPVRLGAWDEAVTRATLDGAGLHIASGMMTTVGEDYSTLESIRETGGLRSDAHWQANLAAARDNAQIAARFGLGLVTLHAGFVPHDRGDRERAVLIDRLRTVADIFGAHGLALGLETGQESAATLLDVLAEIDRTNIGVNFDPANMILYGMGDPVEALRLLSPHVLQIHVKDALPAARPGNWGTEVPVGRGAVDWSSFFDVLRDDVAMRGLMIEREAGDDRLGDIVLARDFVFETLARRSR